MTFERKVELIRRTTVFSVAGAYILGSVIQIIGTVLAMEQFDWISLIGFMVLPAVISTWLIIAIVRFERKKDERSTYIQFVAGFASMGILLLYMFLISHIVDIIFTPSKYESFRFLVGALFVFVTYYLINKILKQEI